MNTYSLFSNVRNLGGIPAFFCGEKPLTPFAYMTYLEKFNKYDEFYEAGCRFFSVPVLFAGRWISATEGFKPFSHGIFDNKSKPDYSDVENSFKRILDICPDALILPRVNMSMPVWWENENPDSVNILPDGTVKRESFYSEKWRADAEKMLVEFITHTENSPFASHIAGYQLAGGNTEEWFHFDLNGGFCKNAEKGFETFLKEHYPAEQYHGLPDLAQLDGSRGDYINNIYLTHFLEYANFAAADAIIYFAAAAKRACRYRKAIGAFYGYTLEVTSPLWGTHALKALLEDKNIDFICSPNSYIGTRSPECDWTEMFPADSVRLHGKMCFQECDIRTHLTVPLHEKDPETDPEYHLSGAIWQGVKSRQTAVNLIRKSFCRQLIKGNGLWWFDMWGGWYSDPLIMREMALFRKIHEKSLQNSDRASISELAVFTDESAYRLMTNCALRNAVYDERKELGCAGIPYDIYDVFDFKNVYKKYKAVIFMSCAPTPLLKSALALCTENNLNYLIVSHEKQSFSADEIRTFCKQNNIHIYCESGDILYINKNFAAICAVSDGEKTVNLGRECKIKRILGPVLSTCEDEASENPGVFRNSEIIINMKKGETVLFEI